MTWTIEQHWRVCAGCRQVWHAATGEGMCSAGGIHRALDGSNYSFAKNSTEILGTPGWRRCGRCLTLWFGDNVSGACPAGERHVVVGVEDYVMDTKWRSSSLSCRSCSRCGTLVLDWFEGRCYGDHAHRLDGNAFALPAVVGKIRLHTKVVVMPDIAVKKSMNNIRDLYRQSAARIDIEWVSDEKLVFEPCDINVGTKENRCLNVTPQQIELFDNRKDVRPREIVIYYVRDTYPTTSGCASHPSNRPGAIVVQGASEWTMAHEVGHVLRLKHVNNRDQLMRPGSADATNPPPDITESEAKTMQSSSLLFKP